MAKFFTFLLIQFTCALVSADTLPEISIRKMTAADILLIAPEQCSTENAEKMSTELNATHDCDIYGAYLICLAESKIGLFMLSDGSESTVLAGAHIDGFKTGKYVNCSNFGLPIDVTQYAPLLMCLHRQDHHLMSQNK